MNKKILSLSAILLLATGNLSADIQVRLRVLSGSGTYYTETTTTTYPDKNIENISGYEISLVTGKESNRGWDYRSVLTLQKNEWATGRSNISDIMLLGEGEIAYNINKYASPFFGFYGGIGQSNINDGVNTAQLTYDLGFHAGVSGDFIENFGYYAKYNFYSWKGFNAQDNTIGIRMSPTTGLFKNLCQSGKITNTQGNTDEHRNRCRAIC